MYLFVLGCVIEKIRESHVHAHSHRVLLGRTIQLDAQDASGTFFNNVAHRPPPAMTPLARKPSIAFASKPSSFRTSSLCSPICGARFAGTLVTPCTWIGLLMVEVSLPPAPSSGTTMSFARSCGSLTTSFGSR